MQIKPKNTKRTEPKPPRRISERYLYNAGLHYLKRYTASTAHFRTIMERKIRNSCRHHTDQDFDACVLLLDGTVTKLKEQGFLDDNQYTHGMVTSYRRRGVSKNGILNKLRQKGLPADLILKTLETIDLENKGNEKSAEITAAIQHARRKKFGAFANKNRISNKSDDPQKIMNRALGSFARAGFSFGLARTILDLKTEDEVYDFEQEQEHS